MQILWTFKIALYLIPETSGTCFQFPFSAVNFLRCADAGVYRRFLNTLNFIPAS